MRPIKDPNRIELIRINITCLYIYLFCVKCERVELGHRQLQGLRPVLRGWEARRLRYPPLIRYTVHKRQK